jgi:hypothetical protein
MGNPQAYFLRIIGFLWKGLNDCWDVGWRSTISDESLRYSLSPEETQGSREKH